MKKYILSLLLLTSCIAHSAGGVVDGQSVSASVTNAAFIFKNAADSTNFKLTFLDTIGVGTTATTASKIDVDASILYALRGSSISNSVAADILLQRARAATANLAATDVIADFIVNGRANGSYNTMSKISSVYQGNGTTFDTDLLFYVAQTAALNLRATIKANGNFLVGTNTDIGYLLAVNGSISGNKNRVATTTTATTGTPITALSSSNGIVTFTGSTATTIQGISAPSESTTDGALLWIQNQSTASLTFKHQNGSASAANRMVLSNAADFLVSPDTGALFYYDGTNSRWRTVIDVSQFFTAVGSSPNSAAASVSGSNITLQPADGTNPGVLTAGAQTIGGAKTFTSTIIGTTSGNTTYTPNNHGVVVSSSTNAMTVIAPDASTTKVLKSGGSSADPTWLAYDNANTASTLVFRDASGNFSAGAITASLSGNATTATTATNATNVAITDDTTTNATVYPTWVTSTTGNLPEKVSSTKLSFNPSTGALTATSFSGSISTSTVTTTSTSTNASFFPLFVASSSNSNQTVNLGTGLTFNPSTNLLTTTTFAGALTGTASGNATITPTNHGVVVSGSANAMTATSAGSSGQVLTSNGASADPTFQAASSSTLSVTSKTTTYTATTSDNVILVDASGGSFTLSLYTAVGNTGKVLTITRTDQTLANAVTIDPNGSETIGGATTVKASTQYESFIIFSDGTNWQIQSRLIPSVWTSYTPTIAGFGTTANKSFYWRRNGTDLETYGRWTNGTVAATTASITLVSGVSIDATPAAASLIRSHLGTYFFNQSTVNSEGSVINNDGTTDTVFFSGRYSDTTQNIAARQNGSAIANSNIEGTVFFKVPISGWQ